MQRMTKKDGRREPWKPGDIVAKLNSGQIELVRVARSNGKRVVSYLRPERVKPIAPNDDDEFETIGVVPGMDRELYQKAASKLYEAGRRNFPDVEEARQVLTEATKK